MLELAQPMGMVMLSWFLFFLLFSGLGLGVLAVLGRFAGSLSALFDSFWLGWAAALAFLQVWHLFFPVNEMALALLAVVAVGCWYRQRAHIVPLVKGLAGSRVFAVVLLLLLLWASNRAIEMPDEFDTGLRDIQAVMWMDTYPIVPGLNNLSWSLAYNHSVYLYDALLDVSIWSGRAFHIAFGLLLMVVLAYSLRAVLCLYGRDSSKARWSWIYAALMLPYLLFYTVGRGGITHFLTDTMVDLAGIVVLIYLLDFAQRFDAKANPDYHLVLRPVILVVAGFTIKQTFWVFGASVAVVMLALWVVRGGWHAGVRHSRRAVAVIVAVALAMMVPWMLRGVVTSGYIAYPLSIGRVEVEWAEPEELMTHRQLKLATNTRDRYGDSDVVLASWDWIGDWFSEFSSNVPAFVLPSVLAATGLALYFGGCWLSRREKHPSSPGLWVLMPLLIMLVFWFFTYPNIKYVRYIIWSFAALSLMLAALAWRPLIWRLRVGAVYAVIGLCLLYWVFLIVAQRNYPLPAGPHDGLYARSLPQYSIFETDSGLKLNVPDSHIHQCWWIPLPCTPFPRAGIVERVPGKLRHGFAFREGEGAHRSDE